MKAAVGYAVLMTAISVAWLFSPRPLETEPYCGNYRVLNRYMGYVWNCDSNGFVRLAREPGRLLRPGEVRQARPLFVVVAAVLGHSFEGALSVIKAGLGITREFAFLPYYAAFLALNGFLLGSSVWLFHRLLKSQGVPTDIIWPLAIFLIANNLTKPGFWTAHQYLFTLFTPIVLVAVVQALVGSANVRQAAWPLAGFLGGVMTLAYGSFAVALPVLVLACVISARRTPGVTLTRATLLGLSVFVAFVLPPLAWVRIVTSVTGAFYHHEIGNFRQVVWLEDTRQLGFLPFASEVSARLLDYLRTFGSPDILVFIVAAVVLWAWRRRDGGQLLSVIGTSLWQGTLTFRGVIGLVLVALLVALWVLGFYHTRLTFSLVPLLLLSIGLDLDRLVREIPRLERPLYLALALIGVGWTVVHITKYGPFQ